MKELLAISWAMPPRHLPRALQVSRALKALAGFGWQTTVIAAAPRSSGGLGDSDPELETAYRGAFRLVEQRSLEEGPPARFLVRVFPGLRFAIEEKRLWQRRAAWAAGKLLKAGNFRALITFAQPWADHLIGLGLHRKTGIPWIAHFSDPWADNPYQKDRRANAQVKIAEESVIREADAVVFITRQTADLVMRKYPAEWQSRVHVIPHGYDMELAPATVDSRPAASPLRLVYTGVFYPGIRTPAPLLHALQNLQQTRPLNLEVIFVGPQTEGWQAMARESGLGRVARFPGERSYAETMREAAQADVLLVIDAPSETDSVFLPSKLVDYLMLKRPILGLTPSGGASADLLRRLGCRVVPPNDVPAIAGAVADLVELKREGKLSIAPEFEQVAAEYDIRRTTRSLDEVLCRVTNTRTE